MTVAENDWDKADDENGRYICMDCAGDRTNGPEMAQDGRYCVHFTPEYWEDQGFERNWGDAAVKNWPHLEILRHWDGGMTMFVILAPHVTRGPVLIDCVGRAWGAY
jgi:hypothetical protein